MADPLPQYIKGQLIIRSQSDHALPKGFRPRKRSGSSVRMSKKLEHVQLIPARENKEGEKKKTKRARSRSPKRK